MKTIKTNVYTLDELDDKAKERARDWYREIDDMPMMEECMQDQLSQLLEDSKIKEIHDVKPYYSLAYCQGDGVMFVGKVGWGEDTGEKALISELRKAYKTLYAYAIAYNENARK